MVLEKLKKEMREQYDNDFIERDTRLIFRTLNNTARVLKNAISDEVVAMEHREGGVGFSEIRPLVAGARGKAALNSGYVDDSVVTADQIVGLIDDIPTCAELIDRIITECYERLSIASS